MKIKNRVVDLTLPRDREVGLMKLSREKIMRESERFLKRTAQYQQKRYSGEDENFQVKIVLVKEGSVQPENIITYAACEDTIIYFYPFRKQEAAVDYWAFEFDKDLFGYLEKGYRIAEMTLDSHFAVWGTIEAWKDGNIEHGDGMRKYLAYCKQNGITKRLLEEKVFYTGMDVMTLYSPKPVEKGSSGKQGERKEECT